MGLWASEGFTGEKKNNKTVNSEGERTKPKKKSHPAQGHRT